MSVTNPEKVVTKQDLADFYGEILPYLGGMPDILANKFNKSDLYSTDEKIIGQWIDGKPLYQKTISGNSPSSGGTETTIYTGDSEDIIVNLSGYIQDAQLNYFDTATWFVRTNTSGRKIIMCVKGFTDKPYAITFQYIKSTDSPVAIGSDTDYSTTEKIVGTWIDGKPIYQKTFTGTITAGSTQNIQIGASVNHIIGVNGYVQGSSFITPVNCIVDSSTEYFTVWGRDNTNTNLPNTIGYRAGNTLSGRDYVITIQYTKTS